MYEKWTKADLRKKQAINRIFLACDLGLMNADMRDFLVLLMHDLLTWSKEAEREIAENPEIWYLKDEQS